MEKRGTAARGTAGSDEARRGWGGTPMPAEGSRSVAAPSTTRITPTYTLMATGSLFPTSSICEKKVPARLPAPTIASAPPPPHNNHPKRKRVKRKCSQQNCENNVVQGGVCLTHGARRKCCSHPLCEKSVWHSGVCSAHMPSRQNATMPTPLPAGLTGDDCDDKKRRNNGAPQRRQRPLQLPCLHEIEINGVKHPCKTSMKLY